jgi:tRNA nucleotidyltransferase (CCA-adding enzyme)
MDRANESGGSMPSMPDEVQGLLDDLWRAGHAAYVVGGSLRDSLLGREAADWDLATDARPPRLQEIFPGSVYENQFGTVAVRSGARVFEITTFRTDHDYADFRRPHRVEFGDSIELDLARRDFTVNALAWGAAAGVEAGLIDPFGGQEDIERRLLRAVGDPDERFAEDALRMVRAVRLAAALDFEIQGDTMAAIERHAGLVKHLSGERIAAELDKLLAAPRPSLGLRLMAETGILQHVSPDLARQRGIEQNKIPGEDLWAHTLRSVDAVPTDRPVVRLAALLHDIGKPDTAADGHFYGHERVGAELAEALLARLHYPRSVAQRVVELVRQHMFLYESEWTDTAVRRFIAKVTVPRLDELFELRRADNVGSGRPPEAAGLEELRARVESQLQARVALDLSGLAIDGGDLIRELGMQEGPRIGVILDALLERVMNDPALNDRPTLLLMARSLVDDPT